MATKLFVVRHAEHVNPANGLLSRKGSLQAVGLCNALRSSHSKFCAVYCSPRSLETAIRISEELGLELRVDRRLLPWDAGAVKGLTRKQVQESMPEVYRKRFVERQPDYRVPNGESLIDRFNRVKNFLQDIFVRHAGGNVIVVTHGGIIDDLFRNARQIPPQQLTGLYKPYGSLSVLVHKNGSVHEEIWGGVGHLPQAVAESPSGGQLYLFPHQVAGSFPMLRGDLGELCKPAVARELEIYRCINKESPHVAKFAPKFTGEVVIDVKHIMENAKTLTEPLQMMHMPTTPPNVPTSTTPDPNTTLMTKRDRPPSSGNHESAPKKFKSSDDREATGTEDDDTMADADAPSRMYDQNLQGSPYWTIDELWERFVKYRNTKIVEPSPGKFVYLIMENLTHDLSRPHIMDLKMGTQQYGRDESPEKVASKIQKVDSTTSKTIGARIAGYQIFDERSHEYVLKDKYWGRSLNDFEFYRALVDFVVDKSTDRIRSEVIRDILAQLDDMLTAVKSTTWKFYGCSVLIVYDGHASPILHQYAGMDSISQDDSAVMPGLDEKMMLLSCADDEQRGRSPSSSSHKHRARSWSFDPQHQTYGSNYSVAVRLIDFAKTERDTDGGCDTGLVFGLENLRRLFQRTLLEFSGAPSTDIVRALSLPGP